MTALAARPLGARQRELLAALSNINLALVVGDGEVPASLVRRGLLVAEPDGSFARITPCGLRAVADEMEAGRIKGWSVERARQQIGTSEERT